MPQITVTVSGLVGSGKSTVALILIKALREAGILTTLADDESLTKEQQYFRQEALVSKLDVVVQTRQIARGGDQ